MRRPRCTRPPLSARADARYVLRCRALLALHNVELDGLTLLQALEAVRLNGRVMDEAVLAAIVGRDEAEALLVVEPLHGAFGTHVTAPCAVTGPSGCGISVPRERVMSAKRKGPGRSAQVLSLPDPATGRSFAETS